MPSVPQHRSSSLEIWGRGEAKSFLLESRAGSIISRWQARARNLACLLTQSHSFQKLEMPPTKSAWGSSTSLRIWRQLPSSSDHHPISLSPPIQILSWKIGGRKNELKGMLSILSTQASAKKRFNVLHETSNQQCICLNMFSFPFKSSVFRWEVDDECRDRFRTSDPSGVIW